MPPFFQEGILRYSRTSYDGDDYARTKLRLSQQKPIENVRSGVPSTLTNIVSNSAQRNPLGIHCLLLMSGGIPYKCSALLEAE